MDGVDIYPEPGQAPRMLGDKIGWKQLRIGRIIFDGVEYDLSIC